MRYFFTLLLTTAFSLALFGCAGPKHEQGPIQKKKPDLSHQESGKREAIPPADKAEPLPNKELRRYTMDISPGFIYQANQFAYDTFKDVYAQEKEGNIVYSPISLFIAMGMAYNGADAETKQAFEKVMGIPSGKEFNGQVEAVLEYVRGRSDLMGIENQIEAGVPLLQSYMDAMQADFHAEFVEAEQPGVVVLRNITEFDGDWVTPFDQNMTNAATFYTEDGQSIQTDMMFRPVSGKYPFINEADLHATILIYSSNEEFSAHMYVFVPQNHGLDGFVRALNPEVADAKQFTHGAGSIRLPKWENKIEISLNNILKNKGLSVAFSGDANFSKMSDTHLIVAQVLQKANISVDEEGTEAKAVTEISMVTSVPPSDGPRFDFAADEPFFYMIVDKPTDLILFMGVVRNPILAE